VTSKKEAADKLIEAASARGARPSEEIAQLREELKDAKEGRKRAEIRLAAVRSFKKQPRRAKATKHITRVVVPDSHGSHIDIDARDVFLRDLHNIAPQEILMLGDHLDCGGTFSSHQRNYTNEMTESYADDVAAANVFLDLIQEAAPNARIYYLEGNHEAHVERWAARNFSRRRDAQLVLDKIGPHAVLELVRRDIEYFRASEFHMGLSVRGAIKLGKLYATHGISFSRHATTVHMDRFGGPVVHGHTHRAATVYSKTVTSELTGGFCPGTLAKLQPLYRHTSPTEWTHGYGLQFASEASGRFVHLNIPIIRGTSLLPELTGALGKR
jgi:hypothetical protein